MTHLNFTQMRSICPTGHLIGIKRKPCEVSQSLLRKPSLNSDIMFNKLKMLPSDSKWKSI